MFKNFLHLNIIKEKLVKLLFILPGDANGLRNDTAFLFKLISSSSAK